MLTNGCQLTQSILTVNKINKKSNSRTGGMAFENNPTRTCHGRLPHDRVQRYIHAPAKARH